MSVYFFPWDEAVTTVLSGRRGRLVDLLYGWEVVVRALDGLVSCSGA